MISNRKKVAIIGAGLQAARRMPAIAEDPEYEVKWIIDLAKERADKLSKQYGGQTSTNWKDAVLDPEVSIALVLTYPDSHAEISIAALQSGKHVLCEKPLTRTEEEAAALIAAAQKS